MTKNLNALDANDQVQFDHLSGTTDSLGFVGLSKVVYGADGAAPTRVTSVAGLPTSLVGVTLVSGRLPVANSAAVDTIVVAGTIDPTTLSSLFSVTPNGNSTVVLKVGTLGTAFPGGTVVAFEKVGVPGAAAIAVNVYPRGLSNSGRVKSTSIGGEFIFAAEAAVSVQVRVSTVGTGSPLAVSAQVAAMAALQPVVPVNVGQTTRLFNEAASQKVVTSATDALSAAIAASEVEIHCVGAALWYNRNAAAVAGSGSRRLAADERTVVQITPGDIVHVIQDTAAGYAVLTPVA